MGLVKRQCIISLAFQLVTSLASTPEDDLKKSPGNSGFPNILFTMADDLGYGDVGYNGGNALTPNLDAMASGPHTLLQWCPSLLPHKRLCTDWTQPQQVLHLECQCWTWSP